MNNVTHGPQDIGYSSSAAVCPGYFDQLAPLNNNQAQKMT